MKLPAGAHPTNGAGPVPPVIGTRGRADFWPQLGGAVAVAAAGLLVACSEAPSGPKVDQTQLPPGLVSRIDGKPLDPAKLARLRAHGEGCTFTVQDFDGRYRRIAVKRAELPFRVRPIQKDPATGLGNGIILSGMFRSPQGGGAIAATCYAPGDMTPQELQSSISASNHSPVWRTVLDRIARKKPVSRAELDRPLSPEAREFLYELVPSAVAPPPEDADRIVTPLVNGAAVLPGMLLSMEDEIVIRCTAMSARFEASLSATAQSVDDITCSCQLYMNELVARDDGEILARWYTWDCELHFSGSPPSSQPGYEEPPMPGGLPGEIDPDGGGTAPPEQCNNEDPPPDDGVSVDSLGREYFRMMSVCDSSATPIPVPCDPREPRCHKPLEASDKQILSLLGPFIRSDIAICDSLHQKLLEVLAMDPPKLWRGDSTVPNNDVPAHSGAMNEVTYDIHIDEGYLVRAKTDTAVVHQRHLAVVALHEVAHFWKYKYHEEKGPYVNYHPFNRLNMNNADATQCVRY